MEIKKEKNFPRGGKKPALFKANKNNSSLSFLKKSKVKPKKKGKKAFKQSEKNRATEKKTVTKPRKEGFTVKFVEDLKPSVVQDGMLVLGIISKIMEKILIVSLPGGLRGAITLANVSEFYRTLVENSSQTSEVPTLADIFKLGEVLPVKVLAASEKHHSLMVTCDPKVINEKLSYSLIENGFILTGNIRSQEEHGFIIDFGIEYVNGFLNYEKVNEPQNFKVGQLVRCCIIQSNVAPGSCSVQLSALKKDIQSAFIKKSSTLPVYCFIPGFQFEVTVKKTLTEGLQVSYGQGDGAKGYIHEDYLLKKFSNPTDVEIGSKFIAALLYVKPLVNFLYFKVMPKKDLEWPFKFGEIVSGKVAKVRRAGVIFKIGEGAKKSKCFVPVSKLNNKQSLEEKAEILNLYPLNKTVEKIRLANIDLMGRYYVGATDKTSLTEKYYSVSDLKCGDIVSCKIVGFGKSTARLEIGSIIKGFLPFTDMTDIPLRNPTEKFKVGQKVKTRVVEVLPEKLSVRLTMKPTLLKEKEILCDFDKCKINNCYVGTVIKVASNKIIVKFFNQIFGTIPKHLTSYPEAKHLTDHFHVGQLLKCTVIGRRGKNSFQLSLLTPAADGELEVGKKYTVVVMNNTADGLFLDVIINNNTKCKGYLPSALMSVHQSLAHSLATSCAPGEKLTAYCISNETKTGAPLFGAEEVFQQFYEGKSKEEFKKLLTEDSVLPFFFRNKNSKKNQIFLGNLVPGKNDLSIIVVKDDFSETCPLRKYQLIFGKILSIRGKRIEVSVKVCDVWDKDFHSSLELLDSYLIAMSSLVLRQKKLNTYNGDIHLGCLVNGVIEKVGEGANGTAVRTEDGDLGIVEGKFEEGEKIRGRIIWIEGPQEKIYIKAETNCANDKNNEMPPLVCENDNLRGKVILIKEEVIVLELKGRGRGELAFLPRRRHVNDISTTECVISEGEDLRLWITRKNSNYILAMDRRIVSMQEKIVWKKSESKLKESVQSLKRKLESEKIERHKKHKKESELDDIQVVNVKLNEKCKNGSAKGEINEYPEVKEEIDVDNDAFTNSNFGTPRLQFDDIDIKSEADDDENEKQNLLCSIHNDERIELSSSSESEDEEQEKTIDNSKAFEVGFNWEVLNNRSLLSGVVLNKDEPSSEDEEDESKQEKKKRRRLTALEKKEKAKSEEERLRFIEERLMDTERQPESADDFDRAVLSEPNSSALWLKYMAFHIQGTEIEKARAVARRALKAISFREEQERLNVWIALLNLENMYGTEDSLSKTLNEALQVNEPYKIHLHMLNIHGQDNKFQEMERLGNYMLKKYKDIGSMWCDIASAYFSVGKIESARNVLQKGLAVVEKIRRRCNLLTKYEILPLIQVLELHFLRAEKKNFVFQENDEVPLISKFAQLENKYGSPERAQTLYESILASFPKRVDIWCCYVDMLIKSNCIDLARQVLERATSQTLRPKKMKTLFKKFIGFEEVHGTPENVEKVREAAVEYVQTVGSVND